MKGNIMAFAPATIIRLLSVPLDMTQQNQVLFPTVEVQTTTMMAMTKHLYTSISYQRKESIIRIPENIDALWDCNYVMYDNSNFTGKWFYAFITKMEYINDNATLVYIKTDVFQTWFLDCELLESFVVREHEEGE